MRKGRRSVERLFYLGLGWVPATRSEMAGGAPAMTAGEGAGATLMDGVVAAVRTRAILWIGALVRAAAAFCVLALPQVVWGQPALTTVSDTVYRADGTAAGGVALISWPTFQTSGGNAVAAGTKTVAVGTAGAFSTQLTPNAGATPVGTFYTVVFQLDDGTVRREYWAVGTTTPTTIAAVRTAPGTGVANGLVSKQYVDTAVASRAVDTAVVHLAGAETIQGAKQFSAAPAIPAPTAASSAANKAYVDAAVANVGAGNFVAKAGDTMTGPLTLAGDPTGLNHAANRHYVDTGLVGKANLVNGLVPTNQLGSGTADGTLCLKGSSSWGACGTSADAVSIRGTTVGTAAPTDGQVITYEASSNTYKPKPGATTGSVYQTTKFATDFQFTLTSTTDLTTAGAKTVTLTSCPAGVRGDEADYWVYVAGTGTAEAAKVTGGTCVGDGNAGTLQFTTVNGHATGYTIASASAGIAEASIAARYKPKGVGSPSGGLVIAPTGDISIYGQLTIKSIGQTIQFTGGTQACFSATTACVYIGDKSNSNNVLDVTLLGFRGRPMVANGTQPMIEVNAQHTRIQTLQGLFEPGKSFGSWVKVDDDQSFLLDGLDTSAGLGTIRCDTTFCGAYIQSNGTFNGNPQVAPVGWLQHLNLNLQCDGNGVDWQSGNTLRISDSVIQGYTQFGVRYSTATGGYGGLSLENVYEEYGSGCGPGLGPGTITNAAAGVIMQGGSSYTNPSLSIRGGEGPSGNMPAFATGGSTLFQYYVVARKADGSVTLPLFFGNAQPTSGALSIPLQWYDLAPATSYDILVVSGSGIPTPPYGTGNYAVAANVPQSSVCVNGVCSYTDTQAARSSYTLPAYWMGASNFWTPKLNLWPGGVILSPPANSDFNFANHPVLYTDLLSSSVPYISAAGGVFPQVFALHCQPTAGSGGYVWPVCLGSYYPQTQMRLMAGLPQGGSGSLQNVKGVLNIGVNAAASGPTHLITLFDFEPDKTAAYAANRAPNSSHDTFIGIDSSNTNTGVGLSLGSFGSISQYVANNGDGTNWLERLTATLKEFKTPAKFDGTVTIAGLAAGCLNIASTGVVGSTGAACGSGGGGGSVTSVFGRSGAVVAASGDYSVSQVTGAAADSAVVHNTGTETIAGAKTFSNDMTLSGNLNIAGNIVQTGSGPWNVEGAYGAMTAAGASKSKIGFTTGGKLAVSENAGTVTEVAKNYPQEFTYTFFDANNLLTTALQVPSIYVNRSAAFHIVEVYCEIDAGSMTVNLQNAGANLLSSDLACSTSGATSSSFVSGKDAVGTGVKIGHVTVSASGSVHRVNVVVKYTVD